MLNRSVSRIMDMSNLPSDQNNVRQNEPAPFPQDHGHQNSVRLVVNLSNDENDSRVSEMVEHFLQNLAQALGGESQPSTRQSQPAMTEQQADLLLDEVLAETLPERHRGVKRGNTNREEPSKRCK